MPPESQSSSSSSTSAASNRKRIGLCVFATLYTFLFVGALFGWGPMQRMLESSGAFGQTCLPEEPKPCPKQSTTIIQINFVAITTNTLTPFMGQAIDIWGAPAVATYFMSPCAVLGSAIVAYTAHANSPSSDHWYFVGFSFLGLATFCGSLLSVQVGLYFGGTLQVRIIMLLNALFDAGSVTYLFLWYMMERFDVGFETVCLGYFVLALVCYGGGIVFWNTATPVSSDNNDNKLADETTPMLEITSSEGLMDIDHPHHHHHHKHFSKQEVRESLREFQAAHMENPQEIRATMLSYRGGADGHSLRASLSSPASGEKTTDSASPSYVLIADRSPKDQILSWPYVMLTFFFSINMVSCNWSLATAADFLASLGDDNGTYLSLFTIMQPASVFALPLVDATVHKFGFGTAFQCVNGLTFVYVLIKLTSHNLNVQIVTFVMVAVVRCYLFAVTFSFLPRLLSPDAVGKGTGFLYMVGGVASFVNIPLNNTVLHSGFFPPNLLYLLLTIPTTFMAVVVQLTIAKEDKAKRQKQQQALMS
ncbi:hypothetical protein IV203_027101 [Nitzschia inconspicua]|uniref:Uncharacterized protein n=1 Tax=Nitzschia inconspicua TaxID=303405 RepID=A0A9K3LJV4_9STRA|nr:hypothetical protein IV203_027101 [Nitzschia inconspicua]